MQRHRFHSICPYFAMFPEEFVRKHVLAWTRPGDIVFDPFSGRGTTVFESLLQHRRAYGTDINPVAACLSGAKADPPTERSVRDRVDELRRMYNKRRTQFDTPAEEFFAACFHPATLSQIRFMRDELRWRETRTDRFIAALMLGRLHGESHRSPMYLSNRMPRTISTKPAYSIAWWSRNGYQAPARDTFKILADEITYRYRDNIAPLRGRVAESDARRAGGRFPSLVGRVALVVTSPPYLDTTNFREDQWLRLWFLGGPPHPPRDGRRDDRHTNRERYWAFLDEAWDGVVSLLQPRARIVIRIGGIRLTKDEIVEGLRSGISKAWGHAVEVTSAGVSEIRNSQVRTFTPEDAARRAVRVEYDIQLQRPSRASRIAVNRCKSYRLASGKQTRARFEPLISN